MHLYASIPLAAFFVAGLAIHYPKVGDRAFKLHQSDSVQAHSLTPVSDNCTQSDSSGSGGSDDRGCGRRDG